MLTAFVLVAALRAFHHEDDPYCPAEQEQVTVDISLPERKFAGCQLTGVSITILRNNEIIYPVLGFTLCSDCRFRLGPGVSSRDFWRAIDNATLRGQRLEWAQDPAALYPVCGPTVHCKPVGPSHP